MPTSVPVKVILPAAVAVAIIAIIIEISLMINVSQPLKSIVSISVASIIVYSAVVAIAYSKSQKKKLDK